MRERLVPGRERGETWVGRDETDRILARMGANPRTQPMPPDQPLALKPGATTLLFLKKP